MPGKADLFNLVGVQISPLVQHIPPGGDRRVADPLRHDVRARRPAKRTGRRAQWETGCLPLEVSMMYASVDTALYFVGTLVIAIAFVAIMVLFADCAWCAWRDRWQAKHHH